jgi:hypothetical protein
MTWQSANTIAKSRERKQTWTKEQIRQARRKPLVPILKERGYHLRQMPKDNFRVEDEGDLVVKKSYWVWESRELKGNAIDFFMLVECRSFNEAMEILTEKE